MLLMYPLYLLWPDMTWYIWSDMWIFFATGCVCETLYFVSQQRKNILHSAVTAKYIEKYTLGLTSGLVWAWILI